MDFEPEFFLKINEWNLKSKRLLCIGFMNIQLLCIGFMNIQLICIGFMNIQLYNYQLKEKRKKD